jgi:hypothetical protein
MRLSGQKAAYKSGAVEPTIEALSLCSFALSDLGGFGHFVSPILRLDLSIANCV